MGQGQENIISFSFRHQINVRAINPSAFSHDVGGGGGKEGRGWQGMGLTSLTLSFLCAASTYTLPGHMNR